MFGQQKQPPIKSLIANGTSINGDITFTEGLRIDGSITGNLIASKEIHSLLVISESAVIVGNVSADHVIINGKIEGSINANELLELQPKANIQGDISYGALEMHQGAVISGKLNPLGQNQNAPVLALFSDQK